MSAVGTSSSAKATDAPNVGEYAWFPLSDADVHTWGVPFSVTVMLSRKTKPPANCSWAHPAGGGFAVSFPSSKTIARFRIVIMFAGAPTWAAITAAGEGCVSVHHPWPEKVPASACAAALQPRNTTWLLPNGSRTPTFQRG